MEQTGTLLVQVIATNARLPIEGATVVVTTQAENGKFELVSVQHTDRSGNIQPVKIATPAGEDSTAQSLTGERPFTQCDVWAEHPGYTVLRAEGVQVFPDVVTRQTMELIPLGEGEHGLGNVDLRDITIQNL